MATTALRGTPVSTSGELPDVGDHAPEFTLTSTSLADVSSEGLVGSRVVLNIFPSVDTGVCAASVRRFNELAGSLDNTTVVNVSLDLPFALSRFCGAEGIENVTSASAFRSTFGDDYGVRMVDGVKDVANYVRSLNGLAHDSVRAQRGKEGFEANCVACHGADAKGNPMLGAPNLTDNRWLYGSSEAVIVETVTHGRNNKMPAFGDFLGEDKVHLLTAYVLSLSKK